MGGVTAPWTDRMTKHHYWVGKTGKKKPVNESEEQVDYRRHCRADKKKKKKKIPKKADKKGLQPDR